MEIKKNNVDIIGYEGLYTVDCYGNIYSSSGKIKVNTIGKRGYFVVDLWKNNKRKNYKIHRLIAEYFIPNPEAKKYINHKNGIKTDNRIENLEWCTFDENMRHSRETKLNNDCGENHHNSKLKESDVVLIRGSILSDKQLSLILPCSRKNINDIRNRKIWKNVK